MLFTTGADFNYFGEPTGILTQLFCDLQSKICVSFSMLTFFIWEPSSSLHASTLKTHILKRHLKKWRTQCQRKCPSQMEVLSVPRMITIRTFADLPHMFTEPELSPSLSWDVSETLLNDKKRGTICMCLSCKWERQLLRRQSKDSDSQTSHVKQWMLWYLAFICGTLTIQKEKKKESISLPRCLLFAARKHLIERKRARRKALSISSSKT